jgi:alpha-L-arabinofuranosidase
MRKPFVWLLLYVAVTSIREAGPTIATNSIDAPQAVAPVVSKVSGVRPGFTYTVPAHGIVVLTLEAR